MTIVIITPEALRGFTHPAIDLTSGQLVELEAEPAPEQLELFDTDGCAQGDHNAEVAHCRNYLT